MFAHVDRTWNQGLTAAKGSFFRMIDTHLCNLNQHSTCILLIHPAHPFRLTHILPYSQRRNLQVGGNSGAEWTEEVRLVCPSTHFVHTIKLSGKLICIYLDV